MDLLQPRRWSRFDKVLACTLLTGAMGALLACGGGPPRGAIPIDLASYPSSPAFNEAAEVHVNAGTDREQRVLLTTWFLNGDPRVAQYCSVRPDGTCVEYQFVSDVRSMQTRKSLLPPQSLKLLQDSFRDLPPSVRPALENVLIVSYRDEAGAWQTRVYDRTSRPAAVSTIFGVTNAPILP